MAQDTAFSYYCPNTAIDHEHQFCGKFEVYSKGEYITKGRTEFNDYNNLMTSATQSNLASYISVPASDCSNSSCLEYTLEQNGGQYFHAEQGGPIALLHAELPNYVSAIVDNTGAYTGAPLGDYPGINSVTHASRSLVYLRGTNRVVYYDRGESATALSKQVYLVTTGAVTLSSNTASWATRSGGQKAYFTSLLPSGGVLSNAGLPAGNTEQGADWEPAGLIKVDGGATTSARFLSVLEWGPASLAKTSTTAVQSATRDQFRRRTDG